jgi:hypothetical protein
MSESYRPQGAVLRRVIQILLVTASGVVSTGVTFSGVLTTGFTAAFRLRVSFAFFAASLRFLRAGSVLAGRLHRTHPDMRKGVNSALSPRYFESSRVHWDRDAPAI